MQREIALQKRKVAEAIKQADDLRKEIRTIKENSQSDFKKKAKGPVRPVSSHPYPQQNRPDSATYSQPNKK